MGLEGEIYKLIGTYGIKLVHEALDNYMKEEYKYIKKVFNKENTVVNIITGKVYRDPKEMKEWQKDQEEQKYKEYEKKGINPKDLLTKENLKKWLEEEGRTYSYIAREYVGCKDIEVSAIAKLFGIKKVDKIE